MALVIAIGMAMNSGFVAFWVMVVLILLGLIYAVPVILPASWQSLSALKIKDIPTSKTFSVPLAWASVTVIAPHVSTLHYEFAQLLYAFWVIFLTVLVRTALLDLLAVRGDRLVGKETLVVLVGEKRTSLSLPGCSLFWCFPRSSALVRPKHRFRLCPAAGGGGLRVAAASVLQKPYARRSSVRDADRVRVDRFWSLLPALARGWVENSG